MSDIVKLVTNGYIPVPEDELLRAETLIADLRAGLLTGFIMVVVGPETSGYRLGWAGGAMDRMQLLGNLAMAGRVLEDDDMEKRQ